jgi:hypothetical protein
VSPDEELAGVYHWIEPMCSLVPAPDCPICSEPMALTPPENLYFTCEICHPESRSWEPIEKLSNR